MPALDRLPLAEQAPHKVTTGPVLPPEALSTALAARRRRASPAPEAQAGAVTVAGALEAAAVGGGGGGKESEVRWGGRWRRRRWWSWWRRTWGRWPSLNATTLSNEPEKVVSSVEPLSQPLSRPLSNSCILVPSSIAFFLFRCWKL